MYCRRNIAFSFFATLLFPLLSFATFSSSISFSSSYHGAQLTWIDVEGRVWELPLQPKNGAEPREFVTQPREVVGFGNAKIIALACMQDHRLALDNEGRVWAWGANEFGQLGLGDELQRDEPNLISPLNNIVTIGTGAGSSFALDHHGLMFGFGFTYENNLGQSKRILTPTLITGLPEIKNFAVGKDHVLALDNAQDVWSWGFNHVGQLGLGSEQVLANIPTRVTGTNMPAIGQISAAGNRSYFLDFDSGVWIFGESAQNALRPSSCRDLSNPMQVPDWCFFKKIAAFESGLAAITEDDFLWIWNNTARLFDLRINNITASKNTVIICDYEGRIHLYDSDIFGDEPVQVTQIPAGTFILSTKVIKNARNSTALETL